LAAEIEVSLQRPLEVGEPVKFTVSSGNSFRIRTAPFLGIHEYSGRTEALDRVVLADLTTVRSLADYTQGYNAIENDNESAGNSEDLFNFNDLFSEDLDVTASEVDEFSFEAFESDLADTGDRDTLLMTDNGAWSFILIKAIKGRQSEMFNNVKAVLIDSESAIELLSWQQAAGSSALILFAVQSLFYLGLGFLGSGAVLVIMNALVFSVLERVGEIGSMRSLGATPGFIRSLFMMESMIVTLGGAILGIGIGLITVHIVQISGITLSNPLLVSVFGGSDLNPVITVKSVILHLLLALILGGLAWIYPVSLAMKVQPVTAMSKG
jgi:putative ABC transport system permease protein